MAWFEIQITASVELHDPLTNRLFELGAEGINEPDPRTPTLLRGFFSEDKRVTVKKEFPAYVDSLKVLFPRLPKVTFLLVEVPPENWAENFKKYYLPQPLSQNFFLRPAWEPKEVVPTGCIEIIMEPGQAFGTGLHPSTKMCVRFIERALAFFQKRDPVRVLDVGTGTGILAIVAAKLDVGHIEAIDNDPIAVAVAKENCVANGCSAIQVSDTPIEKIKGPFDVVISNILLETHKQLAPQYVRLLEEGGQLILSGLLTPQAAEIDTLFKSLGFVFESSVSLQEWTALAYTKGAKERVK